MMIKICKNHIIAIFFRFIWEYISCQRRTLYIKRRVYSHSQLTHDLHGDQCPTPGQLTDE